MDRYQYQKEFQSISFDKEQPEIILREIFLNLISKQLREIHFEFKCYMIPEDEIK